MLSEDYPALDPREVITISLIEAYSETTGQNTSGIHCMQWNRAYSRWDIEDQAVSRSIEIHGSELQ